MKLKLKLQSYDYDKLAKNVAVAVLTPAATVFSTTGDVQQTKHAALLGVGAAGLLIVGFIQTPYKRGSQASAPTQPVAQTGPPQSVD